MLFVKPGVMFILAPAGVRILEALKLTSRLMHTDLVITSGSDGIHSGPKDPHYSGEAYDVRTRDLSPAGKEELVTTLSELLGDRFYAFLEAPGTTNEHVHVQRKKNTVYGMKDYLESR